MNKTEKQPGEVIDSLATSTRSPRGPYSATESRKLLDRRIAARRRQRFLRLASSAAAAVALVCALSWSAYMYLTPARIVTISTLAENQIVQLPDGSEVTLNRYTTLSYPEKFKQKNREVQLQGGAYFDVAKDQKHPFIVQTGTIDVRVLGTEFSVEAYPDDEVVKTVLLKGSVAVKETGQYQDSLILAPGEKAIYDKVIGSITKEEAFEKEDVLSWKEGGFVFSEQPLKEVARQLSNAFGVQIEVRGESLGEKRMNGRFVHNEKLDDILRLLQETGICNVIRENEKSYILYLTN